MTDRIIPLPSARAPRRASPPSPVADFINDAERRLRDDRPDCFEALRARRPSTLDRIGDALASPRMFTFYLGFYAGCMATVGSAIIAAKVWQ